MGQSLAGKPALKPKNGAKFHFELPGALQGFQPDATAPAALRLENVSGNSQDGQRSLALHYSDVSPDYAVRAATPTFIPPEGINMPGYRLMASPTLYSGQTIHAHLAADNRNAAAVNARLYISIYGAGDKLVRLYGEALTLDPGLADQLSWQVPNTQGAPIAEVGIEIGAAQPQSGTVYLDYLTWDGTPNVMLGRPPQGGNLWRTAWVDGTDQTDRYWPEAYRLVQNRGTGLYIQGTRDWTDYRVSADIMPHLATGAGIAARVQGMRRYYALMLRTNDTLCLVKALDGDTVLASQPCRWEFGKSYALSLQVTGNHLQGWLNGELCFDLEDTDRVLTDGAIALVCEEGRISTEAVIVSDSIN